MPETLDVRIARLELPKPLSTLLENAQRADNPDARHERLIVLWETLLRVMGCTLWACWNAAGVRDNTFDAFVAKEMRTPSGGQWARLLRDAAKLLEQPTTTSGVAPLLAVLDRRLTELPALDALAQRVREVQQAAGRQRVRSTVGDLLQAMPEYRNLTQSSHYPPPHTDQRRRFGDALFEAFLSLCEAVRPTGAYHVVVVRALDRVPEGFRATLVVLHGRAAEQRVEILTEESWRLLRPDAVYLHGDQREFVPLGACAAAARHGDSWALGWYSRRTKDGAPEFDAMGDGVVGTGAVREDLEVVTDTTQSEPRPDRASIAIASLTVLGAAALALTRIVSSPPSSPPANIVDGGSRSTPGARSVEGPRVAIAAGEFLMGSREDEIVAARASCLRALPSAAQASLCREARFAAEGAARRVRVDGFAIDRNEVSNAAFVEWLKSRGNVTVVAGFVRGRDRERRTDTVYAAVYEPSGGRTESGISLAGGDLSVRAGYERRPVVLVTWIAARRYCEEHGGSLPTEAQWEFAARGSNRRLYPWGDAPPTCVSTVFARAERHPDCMDRGTGSADAVPSEQREDVTPAGVFDLGGNVAEWTLDRFSNRYPECAETCRNPQVPASDEDPIAIRGGDWTSGADACRGASRAAMTANDVGRAVGFRCVYAMGTERSSKGMP